MDHGHPAHRARDRAYDRLGHPLVVGKYFDGGTDIGYNRMNFRWGNVGTFQISPGSHMWQVLTEHYKDESPFRSR